jgi:hypothetical protein
MEHKTGYTMEDFMDSAGQILESIKQEQDHAKKIQLEAKKLISTLKTFFLVFGLAVVGWAIRMEVNVANRPTYNEVVSRKDAITVHQLNTTNIERIAAVLSDTTTNMELIKKYNDNYMWMVENIFNINTRGN